MRDSTEAAGLGGAAPPTDGVKLAGTPEASHTTLLFFNQRGFDPVPEFSDFGVRLSGNST
jgi:hypothetical protein